MKKLRVLFVLALALTLVLASTSMAFATYGPPVGPFGSQEDGVAGVSVDPFPDANGEFSWTYDNNTKILEIFGSGWVKVCWPGNSVSSILVGTLAVPTFESGTAICANILAPAVVQGIK